MSDNLPTAEYPGELEIAGWTLPVSVLSDGSRIFSERGLMSILGIKGRGTRGGHRIPTILGVSYIKPLIPKETWVDIENPIRYRHAGNILIGYPASVLGDIVKTLVQANKVGALRTNAQRRYAEKAEILRDALVNVALDLLIDGVTGYDKIRDIDALQQILDKYLRRELAAWAKRFPDEFYEQIFRLKSWKWEGMNVNRPGVIGTYTNDIVYERLAPGLLPELQRLNPVTETGNRDHKHHQWLTETIGHPRLRDHLVGVVALMRGSTNWTAFMRSLKLAYPITGDQDEMDV